MVEETTVQGTSPLITTPTHLSEEALRPASTDDVLAVLGDVKGTPTRPGVTGAAGTRRRGRPPGSKNRTPAQKLAETDPEAAKKQKDIESRAARRKRAQEIEAQIYGELNDHLMSILMGSLNIPSDFLYLPGKEPEVTVKDSRFTELGNRLAIPPNLAKSIGRLAAEIEQTDAGAKVAGVAQGNNVGLIVASAMSIFGMVQYARTLSDTMEKVKPLLEARKRFLEEQAVAGAKHAAPEPANDSQVGNSGSVS
jgi:hypothetical protein